MSALPLLALLAAVTPAPAGAEPRIELISIGPGDALYAAFGHTALRVRTPDGADLAYNFGGMDFAQRSFYLRFLQGRLEAFPKVTSYAELLLEYAGEDRTVIARSLALPGPAAVQLAAELARLAGSPDGRYTYHHLDDNCATRVAQLLDAATGGALRAGGSGALGVTQRELVLEPLRRRPIASLAIDLSGTGQVDRALTAWDATFLPEGLDRLVDATILEEQPLVVSRRVDYLSQSFDEGVVWDWPWTKVYLLWVLPLMLLGWFAPRPLAFAYGLSAGLLGSVYAGLWLASDLAVFRGNLNLLTFPPTHLAVALVALWRPGWQSALPVLRLYLGGHLGILVVLAALAAADLAGQAVGPMLGASLPLAAVLVASLRRSAPPAKDRLARAL